MGTRRYREQGAVGETLNFNVDITYIAHQAVVSYYPDDTYTEGTEITPSAGIITVKGRSVGASEFDVFDGSPLDCTDVLAVATARGILDAYQVVPSGITGATHYRVTFMASETN